MLVGESVLVGVIRVLLAKLMCRSTLDFFTKWKLDTSLLNKLETLVNCIEVLLNDAEERQFEENARVKRWLDNVKFAFFDAEDLLDTITTYSLKSDKVRNRFGNSVGYWWKETIKTCHPYKRTIVAEMNEIIARLQELLQQKDILGLAAKDVKKSLKNERLSTSLINEKSITYGRELDKEAVIQLVNSREGNDDALRVIPIVGMGGVGKTTLACMVYNEYEISSGGFDMKGWVCVSDDFDVTLISKSLLESIKGSGSVGDHSLEMIQQELKETLQGKRFLLVLDDVWNENCEKWDTLRTPLSVGARGSRIIVTTRKESVALLLSGRSNTVFRLQELSKDDCFLLLKEVAFPNGDSNNYPKLEQIGEDISSRAKGLPLAAKMLGALLLSKGKDENEWNAILNSRIWTSANHKVLPSLWLSYHHLPMHIKQCLAYCSIFPKDYIFDMEELIVLWMAEGLIEESCENLRLEDVGKSYITHLRSNSFIQLVVEEESHPLMMWDPRLRDISPVIKRKTDKFVMHDLIHDLAEYVSGDLHVSVGKINPKSRWLSYNYVGDNILPRMESTQKLPKLRTLLSIRLETSCTDKQFIKTRIVRNFLSNLKLVRVLSLKGYKITSLPSSIRDLEHLRILDLSDTIIKSLPKSMSSLYNLQTLILSRCRKLTRLPSNICDLVNLRRLDITRTGLKAMPVGMSRLQNLQMLSYFLVDKRGSSRIMEFRDLPSLRGELHISGLENVKNIDHVIVASFGNKQHLEGLHLEWLPDPNRIYDLEENVLEAIQPHYNLQILSISGFGGGTLSRWMGDPLFTHMVDLSIRSCSRCEALPSLGCLPVLKHLTIRRLDCVTFLDERFHGKKEVSFPSLKTLVISGMKVLKSWSSVGLENGGFPSLVQLDMEDCPRLANIPSLGCLPALKYLSIQGLHGVTSVDEGFYGKNNFPFPSLESLAVHDMNVLKTWLPCGLDKQGFPSLLRLNIIDCPVLDKIPYCYPSLNTLTIGCCPELIELEMCSISDNGEAYKEYNSLPTVGYSLHSVRINECDKLRALPKDLHNLIDVNITFCRQLVSLPHFKKLEKLRLVIVNESFSAAETIGQIKEFEILNNVTLDTDMIMKWLIPDTGIANMSSVKNLFIRESGRQNTCFLDTLRLPLNVSTLEIDGLPLYMEHLPELERFHGIKTLPAEFFSRCCYTLVNLDIRHCFDLKCLPESLPSLRSLRNLSLSVCPCIQQFPSSGFPHCTNLTSLEISYLTALISLPDGLHNIISLRSLHVTCCPNLVISQHRFPTRLTSLRINDCDKIKSVPDLKLHTLTFLQVLSLGGFSKHFPSDHPLPGSITQLSISNFPHLKSLTKLLPTLPQLRALKVQKCANLRPFLPPRTVSTVEIYECRLIR